MDLKNVYNYFRLALFKEQNPYITKYKGFSCSEDGS